MLIMSHPASPARLRRAGLLFAVATALVAAHAALDLKLDLAEFQPENLVRIGH